MPDAPDFRCPECQGTDLRAEVPCFVTLAPDGACTLENIESVTGSVFDLVEDAYAHVFVSCEECEHTGKLPEFETEEDT